MLADVTAIDIVLMIVVAPLVWTTTFMTVYGLFNQPVEVRYSYQREAAILAGHTDRQTIFEIAWLQPIMWVLLSLASGLSVLRLKESIRRNLVASGNPNYYSVNEYLSLALFSEICLMLLVAGMGLLFGQTPNMLGLVLGLFVPIVWVLFDWQEAAPDSARGARLSMVGFLVRVGILCAHLLLLTGQHFDTLIAFLSCELGFWFPLMTLGSKAKARVRAIAKKIPYALDLIALSMGAGGTFTEAVGTLVREDPTDEFNRELGQVLAEVELGKTRSEALLNMAERIPLESLRTIVGSILQAESLGTPLTDVLKSQANLLRHQRSVRAEKLAATASVRILIPSVLILLAVIIIVFAPMILRFFRGGFF